MQIGDLECSYFGGGVQISIVWTTHYFLKCLKMQQGASIKINFLREKPLEIFHWNTSIFHSALRINIYSKFWLIIFTDKIAVIRKFWLRQVKWLNTVILDTIENGLSSFEILLWKLIPINIKSLKTEVTYHQNQGTNLKDGMGLVCVYIYGFRKVIIHDFCHL